MGIAKFIGVAAVLAVGGTALGQGVLTYAFTYQGSLTQSGAPATGQYDMEFRLFGSPAGIDQQGVTICRDNVVVTEGLFTVPLDFGAQFYGQQRFMEIRVRAGGPAGDCAVNPASYTLLTPRQSLTAAPYALHALSSDDWRRSGGNIFHGEGNVGIGTSTPAERLEVFGNIGASNFFIGNSAPDSAGAMGFRASGPRIEFWGNDTPNAGLLYLRADAPGRILVDANLGIGTAAAGYPITFSNADGDKVSLWGEGQTCYGFGIQPSLLQIHTDSIGADIVFGHGSSAAMTETVRMKGNGRVGIGTSTPAELLDVAGTTRTHVLQITGGSDLAEPFDVSPAADTTAAPGMVVVIDEARAGDLRVATTPYDRRVAGVISGANGLSPGMVMRAAATPKADGEHPVALTGRVWVWCDAAGGAITPGDRLTTSATPGHAMRVGDPELADGAVLGKAMTALKEGRGLVLMLVQPQ